MPPLSQHFGYSEDIEKRLVTWHRQLGQDRRYPWVGTGLLDDLRQAALMLGAKPEAFNVPKIEASTPTPEPVEYDL